MEEKFFSEGDYKIEESYFKIVEEAYDLLEDVKSDLLEDVIEKYPDYEDRNEIIHELSDILARHSTIKVYKIENLKVTKARLEAISAKSIRDTLSKAKEIESLEQKSMLYEHAAESALINAGIFGNKTYINFGKKKYLEASDIWKELDYLSEADIDINLSKKFEYYAIILNCINANQTIKKIDDMIMKGEEIIESTIDKVSKNFKSYVKSQNDYKTKFLSEEPDLKQLKKEESKKFLNVLKPILEKKISFVEKKLINYFDALRDAYISKDNKLVKYRISEIKKEVINELGKNSFSIFGWPKEQTEENIEKWINAYTNK